MFITLLLIEYYFKVNSIRQLNFSYPAVKIYHQSLISCCANSSSKQGSHVIISKTLFQLFHLPCQTFIYILIYVWQMEVSFYAHQSKLLMIFNCKTAEFIFRDVSRQSISKHFSRQCSFTSNVSCACLSSGIEHQYFRTRCYLLCQSLITSVLGHRSSNEAGPVLDCRSAEAEGFGGSSFSPQGLHLHCQGQGHEARACTLSMPLTLAYSSEE